MAFADRALFGYVCYDDLLEQEIPEGRDSVQLRWTDEAAELPILRHVEADGTVTTEPMKRQTFERIFNAAVANEGYPCQGGMHKVRRTLGKKLDGRYTEAVRSQHITHTDPRIFGRSYMANTSSANGKRAFLDEEANHEAVDHFQGLEQFREEGLPLRLSAQKEAEVSQDAQVLLLEQELRDCGSDIDRSKEVRKKISNLLKRLKSLALKQYQKAWIREQRDLRILTRGKLPTGSDQSEQHILISLLPERRRIAELIQLDEGLTDVQMRQVNIDLYFLCIQDCTVVYRPGEEPTTEGECPVCECKMEEIPKRSRSNHIHNCRYKQVAQTRGQNKQNIRYCQDCFAWLPKENGQWSDHCDLHLPTFTPTSCDRLTYSNTTVKEFRCGGCAGPQTRGELRLKPYQPHNFWPHITDYHINTIQSWPAECFYYGCNDRVSDKLSLEFHLKDAHYRACRNKAAAHGITRKRKRSKTNSFDPVLQDSVADSNEEGSESNMFSTCSETQIVSSTETQNYSTDVTPLLSPDFEVEYLSHNSVASLPSVGTTCEAHTKPNGSSMSSLELDIANLDPRLGIQDEVQRGQFRETITQPISDGTSTTEQAEVHAERDSFHRNALLVNDFEAQASHPELTDEVPVEVLRARCQGWYLTKWVGWGDKYNEWRLREDLLLENLKHVEEYDMAHARNSFGTIAGKRLRNGVTEYRMKWNYLSMRNASWLLADEVESQLIDQFEAEETLKKAQPRRKKRKILKKY